MTSSKHIIFGSVVGLIFIFGGTFVFLDDGTQIQNNSEYQNHTNRTGTNSLPVTSSEITIPPTGLSAIDTGATNSAQTGFVFHAPNTEWKARTITLNDGRVVTYRFGEGNPEEVETSSEALNQLCVLNENIQNLFDQGDCAMSLAGNPTSAHVSKEVEAYLFKALSDPNWGKLANECKASFDYADRTFHRDQLAKSDILFSEGYLNLDSFISVNKVSGRKVLNHQKIRQIIDLLEFATLQGGPHNTVAIKNPNGDCVDRFSYNIILNFAQTLQYYGTPYWWLPWFDILIGSIHQ
jgi:hypothetical protein